MAFNNVPAEITTMIIEQVDRLPPEGESLRNLSLCSKYIHELTTPVLYRQVEQNGWHTAPLFMRTILANKNLGLHVKELNLWETSEGYPCGILSAQEVQGIKEIIKSSAYSSAIKALWVKDFVEDATWNAMAALLVHVCPKVEIISFEDFYHSLRHASFIRNIFDCTGQLQNYYNPSGTTYSLANLRKISIGVNHSNWTANELSLFLSLKSPEDFLG